MARSHPTLHHLIDARTLARRHALQAPSAHESDSLGVGDWVLLRSANRGAGREVQVRVTQVLGRSRYAGKTEDGREVVFSGRHVFELFDAPERAVKDPLVPSEAKAALGAAALLLAGVGGYIAYRHWVRPKLLATVRGELPAPTPAPAAPAVGSVPAPQSLPVQAPQSASAPPTAAPVASSSPAPTSSATSEEQTNA